MPRLFVALRPPPPMRDRLRATMHGLLGARWQNDEQLHLTLRFIGDADRHAQADIMAALGRLGGGALSLGVNGVGCFSGKGRVNSIWAAISATPALLQVAKSVDRAVVLAGLAPEARAFRPHVTLARLGRSAMPPDAWLAEHAGLRIEPATFDHLYLYESILGREGSTYIVVDRFPLR